MRYRNVTRDLLDEYQVSAKVLKETRLFLEKEHQRDFSEEEVREVALLIKKLATMALDQVLSRAEWDEKLAGFPKGYEFTETGYTCWLCGGVGRPGRLWYDKYGIKCMPCQRAVETKVVPGSIVENKDSYYSEFELGHHFKLKGKVLREWMKLGLVKGRMITGENGKSKHYLIFLMKENRSFLPPKKMLKGGHQVEVIDGKEWNVFRPWYYFVDPFVYLKKYGIIQYLKWSEPVALVEEAGAVEQVQEADVSYCNTCRYSGKVFETSVDRKRKARRKTK